jgi:hypothetical protein
MARFYVKVSYTFFDTKEKKHGRSLYQERTYDSKKKAVAFVKKVKREKTIEFKRYGGKPTKFKYSIKEV